MTPPPLNLTPKRGPSVWARLDSQPALDLRWLGLTMAAAPLAVIAWRRPSRERLALALLGTACIAGALFYETAASRISPVLERLGHAFGCDRRDIVDIASEASFPASDAPASMRTG